MSRQMLKGICVSSKEELAERIYKYFDEINENPVVFRWTYKMKDFDFNTPAGGMVNLTS